MLKISWQPSGMVDYKNLDKNQIIYDLSAVLRNSYVIVIATNVTKNPEQGIDMMPYILIIITFKYSRLWHEVILKFEITI